MKRFLLLLNLFVVIFAAQLMADQPYRAFGDSELKYIVPSSTRFVVSLAGSWRKSYDGDNWENVSIPYTEESANKTIYERSVQIDASLIDKYVWQIYFLGTEHQIELYFNDRFIGKYYGGMVPLNVRIPERFINKGNNKVKIVAYPSEGIIKQIKRQFLYARQSNIGIIREAFLVGTPQSWISDITCDQKLSNDLSVGNLHSKISISSGNISKIKPHTQSDSTFSPIVSPKVNLTVESTVTDLETGEVKTAVETKTVTLENERTATIELSHSIPAPKLWSPDAPSLYQVKIRLLYGASLIDDYSVDIGFRRINPNKADNGTMMFMNGNLFPVKAVTYIEDYADRGQTLDYKNLEEDIKLIKTLGANIIRTKFAPPHPYLVSLCDKYGIGIFVEIPSYEIPASLIGLSEVNVMMNNVLRQIIGDYDNSPSILAYGLGEGLNEGSPETEKYYTDLLKIGRTLTQKMFYKIIPLNSKKTFAKGFDFIGVKDIKQIIDENITAGQIDYLKSNSPGTPIVYIFGNSIREDNHAGYSDKLSQEYQAYNISVSYKIMQDHGAAGCIVNCFNDYKLQNPLMTANNDDLFVNTAGLVDRYRVTRLSYTTLRALLNDEKEPLLNAGSYRESVPITFIILGIVLLVALVLLLNAFRRFREYFFRALLRPYNFYADIRDQRILSIGLTLVLGLLISLTVGIYLSSILHFYKANELLQYLAYQIIPGKFAKVAFARLLWMPELMCLVISAIVFVLGLFVALLLKIVSFFMRARIYMNDCLTLSIWSAIPLLLLLPVSIFLNRFLVWAPQSAIFFLVLYFALAIWNYMRLTRSAAVLFDVNQTRVYVLSIGLLAFIAVIVLGLYQIKFSFFAYMDYFFKVLFA